MGKKDRRIVELPNVALEDLNVLGGITCHNDAYRYEPFMRYIEDALFRERSDKVPFTDLVLESLSGRQLCLHDSPCMFPKRDKAFEDYLLELGSNFDLTGKTSKGTALPKEMFHPDYLTDNVVYRNVAYSTDCTIVYEDITYSADAFARVLYSARALKSNAPVVLIAECRDDDVKGLFLKMLEEGGYKKLFRRKRSCLEILPPRGGCLFILLEKNYEKEG